MSIVSNWWRGSAKKIIREWYEKERQDIEYKLFGEIDSGLDECKTKMSTHIRERMIDAGADAGIMDVFEQGMGEAWVMYAPDKNKSTSKIMAAIDRYMSKKFGYEIRTDGSKI